jgi:hypothetical protein
VACISCLCRLCICELCFVIIVFFFLSFLLCFCRSEMKRELLYKLLLSRGDVRFYKEKNLHAAIFSQIENRFERRLVQSIEFGRDFAFYT